MSTKNRGDRIQLLHKVVTKHFTPVTASEDRSVLEHMIYACCLEDAKYEQADEAFHRLQESFFDWNEVRVTTASELSEAVSSLPDSKTAAMRVKQTLQSLFESRYTFDIDDMVKMNLGKAVQELEKLKGMTKFVLGYVTQNALGGHSIPVSSTIMDILLATQIVSEAEAAKGLAPGLERTVPKTKGAAFASCLHQMAVSVAQSPGSKVSKAALKDAGAVAPKPAKKVPVKKAAKPAKKVKAAETKEESPPAKKASSKSAAPKKAATKKAAAKPTAKKTPSKPATKKAATKKTTKRKPR